jgi:TetR/AcrR family transcriptional regulator, cholesterol catabolism regulator
VRDIARALDIQGASLYAHVASKQDVLWSIVDRTASQFEAAADEALAGLGHADPMVRLRALALAHVGVVVEDIGRASVFIHEWRSLGPERRARTLTRRDAYEQRFRDVIRAGIEAGTFAPIDPTVAAAYLLTALNGLVAWYQPDGRLGPSSVTDAYVELSIRAVSGAVGDESS